MIYKFLAKTDRFYSEVFCSFSGMFSFGVVMCCLSMICPPGYVLSLIFAQYALGLVAAASVSMEELHNYEVESRGFIRDVNDDFS